MYGQYSELQKFAREFASQSRYRRERKPLTIEEAKRRKSRSWRKFLGGLVDSEVGHMICM